jgi:hypothetical protein
MVGSMIRFDTALLLIGMGASLCGCASRHEAIATEVQQPLRVSHEVSPEPAAATPRRPPPVPTNAGDITPPVPTHAGDITGSTGRSTRPWPKRGTPEWDELQAEELAREQRIKEVLSSICRGC